MMGYARVLSSQVWPPHWVPPLSDSIYECSSDSCCALSLAGHRGTGVILAMFHCYPALQSSSCVFSLQCAPKEEPHQEVRCLLQGYWRYVVSPSPCLLSFQNPPTSTWGVKVYDKPHSTYWEKQCPSSGRHPWLMIPTLTVTLPTASPHPLLCPETLAVEYIWNLRIQKPLPSTPMSLPCSHMLGSSGSRNTSGRRIQNTHKLVSLHRLERALFSA